MKNPIEWFGGTPNYGNFHVFLWPSQCFWGTAKHTVAAQPQRHLEFNTGPASNCPWFPTGGSQQPSWHEHHPSIHTLNAYLCACIDIHAHTCIYVFVYNNNNNNNNNSSNNKKKNSNNYIYINMHACACVCVLSVSDSLIRQLLCLDFCRPYVSLVGVLQVSIYIYIII